jgi:hypothetical protein
VRQRMIGVLVAVLLVGGGIAAGVLLNQTNRRGSGARYVYPKAAAHRFLSSCTVRSHRSTCFCSLTALKNTIPYTTYQQILLEGVRSNTQAVWAAYQGQAASCH